MLKLLLRKLRFLNISRKKSSRERKSQPSMNLKPQYRRLSENVESNERKIREIFGKSPDVTIRKFSIGNSGINALLVHLDGMSDLEIINDNILRPLMQEDRKILPDRKNTLECVIRKSVNIDEVVKVDDMEEVIDGILMGDSALFIDGSSEALILNTKSWEHRQVEVPQTEISVRGPREGFTEVLRVNTVLLRRKIKSPDLRMETMKLGRRTRTNIVIAYIKELADEEIVEEVRRRLKSVDMDAVLDSGYLEEFIEDNPLSPFPTVGNTEAPDKLAAKLLEGRVGIFVEGTPFVLVVPYLFVENLQVREDYYSRPYFASLIRAIRFLALHLTILSPALYVAMSTFHPAIIPPGLLVTMAAAHEEIPFPSYMEALIMGVVFEILREAGVRLPRPVGQAVSIVGALILGEAATRAGIISDTMVLVVTLTAITSFVIPSLTDVSVILRLTALIIGSILGIFGIVWYYIFILIHLASLRSFGVPYMYPLMPFELQGIKDVFIRAPWWNMSYRPETSGLKGGRRMLPGLRPSPAKNK